MFCLGCCWALMAVLAVVGLMNLVWMVAISLLFLTEKTSRYGDLTAKPVGAALVITGAVGAIGPATLLRLAGVAAGNGGAMNGI